MICTKCETEQQKGQRLPGGAFICKGCAKERKRQKMTSKGRTRKKTPKPPTGPIILKPR